MLFCFSSIAVALIGVWDLERAAVGIGALQPAVGFAVAVATLVLVVFIGVGDLEIAVGICALNSFKLVLDLQSAEAERLPIGVRGLSTAKETGIDLESFQLGVCVPSVAARRLISGVGDLSPARFAKLGNPGEGFSASAAGRIPNGVRDLSQA